MRTGGVNAVVLGGNVPLIFNEVFINEGSHYDENSGVFTAPYAGRSCLKGG